MQLTPNFFHAQVSQYSNQSKKKTQSQRSEISIVIYQKRKQNHKDVKSN